MFDPWQSHTIDFKNGTRSICLALSIKKTELGIRNRQPGVSIM